MAHEQIYFIVSGDQMSGMMRQVHVPDDFQKKMNNARQNNQVLAYIGMIGMLGLAIVGAFFGIYCLRKEGFDWQVTWRGAILCGLCLGMVALNHSQLSFQGLTYYYSNQLKWALIIKNVFLAAGSVTVGYIFPILAAASLVKKAYPDRPSLLSWVRLDGYKNPFNRQIIYMAYGATLIFVLYEMAYYWLANEYFGFFLPPGYGVDLNASIAWIEGVSPLLQAFNPGFTEEVIFRLIPIGLLLMFQKQQGGWVWNSVILLQALIFAMCHANYPADPFYARVIELIFPALFLAYLVIYVDVMAAILTHILYDALWFGLGYFTFDVSWAQLIYFVTLMSPLIVCWYGAQQDQKAMMLNCQQPVYFFDYGLTMAVNGSQVKRGGMGLLLGILSLMMLIINQPVLGVASTDAQQAKAVASLHWKAQGYDPKDWHFALAPSIVSVDNWYFSQQYFPNQWDQLIPLFLPMGCYEVMSASSDPQWKDYAFNLRVCGQKVLAQSLILPYEAVKQSASQPESVINRKLDDILGMQDWQTISDATEQYPNRTVILKVAAASLYKGLKAPDNDTLRAQVKLDGDEVTAFGADIHISQEEARAYQSNQAWLSVFQWREALYLLGILVLLGLMVRFTAMDRPHCKAMYGVIIGSLLTGLWADANMALVMGLQQGSGLLVHYCTMIFLSGVMFIFAYVINELIYALRAVLMAQHVQKPDGLSMGLAILYAVIAHLIAQHQPWVSYQSVVIQSMGMLHSPWLMWPGKIAAMVGVGCFIILFSHMVYQMLGEYFKAICLLVGCVLFASQMGWVDPNGMAFLQFVWFMIGFWWFGTLVQRGIVLGLCCFLTVVLSYYLIVGLYVPAVCCGLILIMVQYWTYVRDRGIVT